tara:strand:+ start:43 stop:714 length:672 start_codon:yes stop_codon:yes gene_type:complete
MPDYSESVIYKIVCKDISVREIYVGSSYDINDRKSKHKSSCNNTNDDHYNTPVYKFIREHGGWDNWTIVVLYKYPCNSKQELEEEERRAYDTFVCDFVLLNGRKPFQTEEERREYGKQKSKERYDANRDREAKEARERYHAKKEELNTPTLCECGLMITKQNLTAHKKKPIHTKRMKDLAEGKEIDDKAKCKKRECECGAFVVNMKRHLEQGGHAKRMAAKNN